MRRFVLSACIALVAVAALASTASAHRVPRGDDTFTICSNGRTVVLRNTTRSILNWYLAHGATLGACVPVTPPGDGDGDGGTVTPPTPTPVPPAFAVLRTDRFPYCYSSGSPTGDPDPKMLTPSEFAFLTTGRVPELLGSHYWTYGAMATASRTPSKTPLGNNWYAHCNQPTAPVIGHVTTDGMPVSATDWPKVQAIWGVSGSTVPVGFLNATA